MILVHDVTGPVAVVPLDDAGPTAEVKQLGLYPTTASASRALANTLTLQESGRLLAYLKLRVAFLKMVAAAEEAADDPIVIAPDGE